TRRAKGREPAPRTIQTIHWAAQPAQQRVTRRPLLRATTSVLIARVTALDPTGVSEVDGSGQPDRARPGVERERRSARPGNGRRGDGRPLAQYHCQAQLRTPACTRTAAACAKQQ